MSVLASNAMRLSVAAITGYLESRKDLAEDGRRRVVLLRSAPQWDGPGETPWGEGLTARIIAAPSPLAVHELVLGHLEAAEGPSVLVVLTDREQSELDPAILARVHRQRIETVDIWNVVGDAFGAVSVDAQLRDLDWAAEALLDATPPGGWPPLPGGVLSRRAALTALALRRLRLGRHDTEQPGPDELDTHALLRWSLQPAGPERLLALRAAEREGLAAFLGGEDQAGAAGRILIALVDAGHGDDAVPFGLLCDALWRDGEGDPGLDRARGRIERWLGDHPPAAGEELDRLLAVFGRACREFVSTLLAVGRTDEEGERGRQARRTAGTVLERAGTLARQFGVENETRASTVLAAGLEARFTSAGHALASGESTRISAAVRELRAHELAVDPGHRVRIERVRMAQRLVRWLAADPPAESATVAAALQRQVEETGWADLALEHLEAGGDPDPVLKDAYDRIGSRVRELRGRIDRSFALALASWTAAGTDPGSLLTVETFLDRVVRPVAGGRSGRRVMLLVLDGMSAAIAAELAEELRRQWAEYDPVPDPSGGPRRRAMAAALPTVTSVSRTSLLAGRLMKGGQDEERRLFPAHGFWGGAPAAVFHKDDLRGGSVGDQFGPALTDALNDGRAQVAVVLNTIDDRLAKEQKLGDGAWRLEHIGKLHELLQAAAEKRMAVIITSDHGHVVDRRGSRVAAEGVLSARHRAPGAPLADAEITLSGPRVVVDAPGGEIVALWDADSRYTAQKAGYHGGASLGEVAIPVLAFLPFSAEPPKGWRELGDQRPAWWTHEAVQAVPALPAAPKKQKKAVEPVGDTLFDVVVPEPEETSVPVSPVAELLATPVFNAQLELLARKPPLAKIEAAMEALLESGTLPVTALAQRVGDPINRADGFAAILRQLINYDGVQVLETLPDGRTLRLNRALLRDQFGLDRR